MGDEYDLCPVCGLEYKENHQYDISTNGDEPDPGGHTDVCEIRVGPGVYKMYVHVFDVTPHDDLDSVVLR